MKAIEELKDLTIELEEDTLTIPSKMVDIIYESEEGKCYGFSLYNNGNIAIQRAFMTKGTVFPEHIHKDMKEYMVVYSGKGEVYVEGEEEKVLNVGDCIVIQPNVKHSWKILEDTWMIGITVPADEAYPK